PAFVDPDTRGWQRPSRDPRLMSDRYLIPSGMSRPLFDVQGIATPSIRVWGVCAWLGVAAVRVEVEGGETYVTPIDSPLGAFIVGIEDDKPSARLVPLNTEGVEMKTADGETWALPV
ncbi:MAG TPA: hypothetical protein VNA87_01665, partial [Actinomycetota bacterium]|nr:hypothetical protein [Actinomycetota bacterium]